MDYLYLLGGIELILTIIVIVATRFDILSPSLITLIFFDLSTLCVMYNESFWEVTFYRKTVAIVGSSLTALVLCELIIKFAFSRLRPNSTTLDADITIPIRVHSSTRAVVSLVILGLTAIYVVSVIRVGGSASLSSIAVVHNNEEVSVGTLATLASRIIRITMSPCIFILVYNCTICRQKLKKNLWLLIPIVCGCVAVFFSGVRSTFLYFVMSAFFYAVMLKRMQVGWHGVSVTKYLRKMAPFIVIVLITFVGSRELAKGHSFSSTPIEYLTFYFGSPLHLFNKIINNVSYGFTYGGSYNYPGLYTFQWFYQELAKFGLITDPGTVETRFVSVGGQYIAGGNVYTFLSAPYRDFGFMGMIIYVIILYSVFDIWYYGSFRYARKSSKTLESLILYGAYYYIIFMSFYATMTSQLKIQTIIEMVFTILIYRFIRKAHFKFSKNIYA